MSQLYTGLVNETVVEAVRVALDNYAAAHHSAPEASALPGVITPAEEEVIRSAILTGLQRLHQVQNTLSDGGRGALHAGVVGSSSSSDAQAFHAARIGAASSLRAAMAGLLSNATSVQDVVQQVAWQIIDHLGGSSQPGTRDASAVATVYDAAPAVTRVLEAAMEEQVAMQAHEKSEDAAAHHATAASSVVASLTAAHWMWLSATLVLGYVMVRFVFGRLLGFSGPLSRHRRTRTVLIGLPESGKTALFAQLVRHMQVRETRTTMRESVGPLLTATERGLAATTPGVTIVDCPGHPRLRESMLRAVGDAVNVVVVVDAVTVQDSQHDGVAALAELLLGVLQSSEFYGVRRLLFVCTKRDEVTSYASKAVRKLLEAAMVASIESRQNAMGRVESVRDSNNVVISGKGRKHGGGGGGRRYVLSLESSEGTDGGVHDMAQRHVRGGALGSAGGASQHFSFDQLGIPVSFVDVSSRPHPTEHRYSVAPVEDFILER